jgi:hypothetical protein
MASIDITTIKNAIASWIIGASGLTSDRIRWEGQPQPEPSGNAQPCISIGRFTFSNPGSDWVDYEPNPLVFADKVITLNAATDQATATAHGLTTRSGPVRLTTTGSLAGTGLATGTDYWLIVDGANTFKFATSFLNADAGTFIDIQGTGVGVHSLVDTPDTVKAGEELREVVRGARNVTFNVTCFPPLPTTDVTEAVIILSDISAKSGLRVYSEILQNANIGLLDPGSPTPVAGIQNAVYFEPRAVMTVVFTTSSEVSGTETIIDYVGVDEDPGTRDFLVDLTNPPNEP